MIRLWKLFWIDQKIRRVRKRADELQKRHCHLQSFTREEIILHAEYWRLFRQRESLKKQ